MAKLKNAPVMLVIMDGWGNGDPAAKDNAVAVGKTPVIDGLMKSCPVTELLCSGEAVGLPDGQMGNSEVGHTNIGAGRVVYQELTRITRAIRDGSFFKNEALSGVMKTVKEKGGALHLFGLVSPGGVHSHTDHLYALVEMAKREGLKNVWVHAFLDGRDVAPKSAAGYLANLENKLAEIGVGKIAIISGRFYAMDRDKRWERVTKAYEAIAHAVGVKKKDAATAIADSYAADVTDEFVIPTVLEGYDGMKPEDGVIFFNFRPDRARELTHAFTDETFDSFKRDEALRPAYVTMTQYEAGLNVQIAYPPESYSNTLGEYVSRLGLKQLRIAETEKYAHVTFFFNGGVEAPNPGEDRILVPSPKVATYDLQPEMSAYQVTDQVIEQIEADKYDMIILNFANADMVGHTGIMEAAIKAIETLNDCVPRIVDAVLAKGGQILLTADHGNADVMLDPEGNVVTAHSLNQVPLIHIAEEPKELKDGGKLADIAPTMLTLMGIPVPPEMTGNILTRD